MIGIWVGNAIIAAAFVIYWLIKFPGIQKDTLLFRYSGSNEALVSIITWAFYALALSLPFGIFALANAP